MKPTALPVAINQDALAAFCLRRGIRRLSLFGSVLRPDFDPARSDVDVLAEFEAGALRQAGFEYFGYGEELSALLGLPVDFCSRLHPLIQERVRGELLPVYERS